MRRWLLACALSIGCGNTEDGVARGQHGPDAGTDAADGSGGLSGADAWGGCTEGEKKPCYTGPAATQDIGACHSGTVTCFGGVFGPCEDETTPSSEACNGLDDDCDGTADEDDPAGGSACNSGKPGVCAAGTETCISGKLQCIQDKQPSAELCDTLDNDCNGKVDDAWAAKKICIAQTTTCPSGYYRSKVLLCDAGCGACPYCVNGYQCDKACASTVQSCCVTGDCPTSCPAGYTYAGTIQTLECGCSVPGDTAICKK